MKKIHVLRKRGNSHCECDDRTSSSCSGIHYQIQHVGKQVLKHVKSYDCQQVMVWFYSIQNNQLIIIYEISSVFMYCSYGE